MILDIVAVLASQFGITGLSIYAYHRWIKPTKPVSNDDIEQLTSVDLANAFINGIDEKPSLPLSRQIGIMVEDDDQPEETITAEQHLERLIKIYPHAAAAYHKDHEKKRLNARADRYILRMIMAVEAGDMTVKKTSHHMEFSNGDEIWTSNKYYGYGNLDNSPDNPQCKFNSEDSRVSLYTFMRIVHLEETEFEPILRLKNKTIKVI